MTMRTKLLAGVAPVVFAIGLVAAQPAQAQTSPFSVQIFHNNDGESALLPGSALGFETGGIARFVGTLDNLRTNSPADTTLTISSGDNFLASSAFNTSLAQNRFFDAEGLAAIGYDAIILGNHDFDFGPDVLDSFIGQYRTAAGANAGTYLSANLDFSNQGNLQTRVDNGEIAKSVVIDKTVGAETVQFGIVGATTPNLPFISSPGNVLVDQNVTAAVQAEIDALEANGINNIIFVSHLQGVAEDLALISALTGVDLAIAGGGDDLLQNDNITDAGAAADQGELLPNAVPNDTYPLTATDAGGNTVPIITTEGGYNYIGQAIVNFDGNGTLAGIDLVPNMADEDGPNPGNAASGPVRIFEADEANSNMPTAEDATVDTNIQQLLEQALAAKANTTFATLETGVPFDTRDDFIRSRETAAGNVIAASFLSEAAQLAPSFGAIVPEVAITNTGGIRTGTLYTGELTELNAEDILPFPNFLGVTSEVSVEDFKDLLENAVSRTVLVNGEPARQGSGTGRFPAIAGFTIIYDISATPIEIDGSGNIIVEGERIIDVILDSGEVLIDDGVIVDPARMLTIATIDFLVNGGDQYFSTFDVDFTTLGLTYFQAFSNFVTDDLGGVIAAEFLPSEQNRISLLQVPVPASLALFGLGALAFGLIRRRAA